MSGSSNGVIRIGRKGVKEFAFGEDGKPFKVDVVTAWNRWIVIDDELRPMPDDPDGDRTIPLAGLQQYNDALLAFVKELAYDAAPRQQPDINIAEARDFLARLREQYEDLATFFQSKSRDERASPVTSGPGLRFSVEESSEPLTS